MRLRRRATALLLGLAAPSIGYPVDIVAVDVTNLARESQQTVAITFGQVFKPGQVSAGGELVARRRSTGALIALQVDKKATHGDGSLRHAVLTLGLPSLKDVATIVLARAARAQPQASAPVRLSALLASPFSASISLGVDGDRYTADARELLERARPEQWLSGPLVSEWLVGAPLVDAAGEPHPHLAAYFHVRAYAGLEQVRVDVVVENGWSFVERPSTFDYDVAIEVGGQPVYTGGLKHYHHSRWHKQFWWRHDPTVYVQHDYRYLQATGALPNFAELEPSTDYLNSLRQKSEPLAHGDLTQYFPDSGAQEQIGSLPRWTAAYAVSAQRRAFNAMRANDDHAGSYSVHYRDEETGLPISIADHPMLTTQFDDLPTPAGDNPNVADQAHQPSIAFVTYLVTGDYFYLEEMQFWSSWNQLEANPLPPWGYRQGAKGIFGLQVRGQAWCLRNLGQAAYATPDDHPYKEHLVSSVGHNIEHNEALYASNPAANRLGALRSYDGHAEFAPWMDDFYT